MTFAFVYEKLGESGYNQEQPHRTVTSDAVFITTRRDRAMTSSASALYQIGRLQ